MIIRGQVVYVYDIEVFPNLFTCSCINSESKKSGTWEISQRKNDLPELIKGFLNKKKCVLLARLCFVSFSISLFY